MLGYIIFSNFIFFSIRTNDKDIVTPNLYKLLKFKFCVKQFSGYLRFTNVYTFLWKLKTMVCLGRIGGGKREKENLDGGWRQPSTFICPPIVGMSLILTLTIFACYL